MKTASLVKKLMPSSLAPLSRKIRTSLYRTADLFQPYLASRRYLGMKLYYIKGTGIVDRIRFGSPARVYELELCEQLAKELNDKSKPDQILFDIGANIGLIGMYVAKYTQSQIYSFEPGVTQLGALQANVVANNLNHRWHVSGVALSDKEGVAEFFSSTDARHSGSDGLKDTGRAASSYSYKVSTETLDAWCKKYNTYPTVIKMDVEGGEKMIIDGGIETLKTSKAVIFLEISPVNLAAYPYKARDIVETLESIGYSLTDLEGIKCTADNVEELALKDDVFVARFTK